MPARAAIVAALTVAVAAGLLLWGEGESARPPPTGAPTKAPVDSPRPSVTLSAASLETTNSKPGATPNANPTPARADTPLPKGDPSTGFVVCSDGECGECTHDWDCPPEHACLVDRTTKKFKCIREECKSDDDCPAGLLCRRLLVIGSWNDTTGQCLPPGTKAKGDFCFAASIGEACAPGLVCHNGRCLNQCTNTNECGAAEDCLEGNIGKACVPKCTKCPDGSACVQNATVGECYVLTGTDCTSSGNECADGERCALSPNPATKAITMGCRRLCDPSAPTIGTRVCPEGEVCGFGFPGYCFKKCDRKDRASCPEGQVCGTVTEDMKTWGCIADPGR